jgi:16S rRNA (cytidine1402-2'-O)-methyltransferase
MPLFIIATPIGNLDDITLRALETMKQVDYLACEDTRRTIRLLGKFEIRTPLIAYNKDNERSGLARLLDLLEQGKKVGLVSNAGTPLISDPGYLLVREAGRRGIPVIPIPGPSSVTAALSAAGLPAHRFLFEGFLPKKPGARNKILTALKHERRTAVIFESPYRIHKLLDEMAAALGDREIVVGRELTKVFEEFHRGPISSVRAALKKSKGEFIVIVAGEHEPD